MKIADDITELLKSQGADLVCFADLNGVPAEDRDRLPFGISIAVALNPETIKDLENGPTKIYYTEYERVNNLLSSLSRGAAEFLKDQGYKAISFAATDEGIDDKTHSTRLPHKTVATRAGLGWIGRCALLITETFGCAVRLTKVLTDAELPAGEPIDKSRCGDCTACVDACPARAPSGKEWHVGLYRDFFFDAHLCRNTARRLAIERTGIVDTFCGICIAVCPWTRKYVEKHSTAS